MDQSFTERAVKIISSIPPGKVATYGQIAGMAGNFRAPRQVAGVLHRRSKKEGLPWFRVINGKGGISLPRGAGFEEQEELLRREGIEVVGGRVDLSVYLWNPGETYRTFPPSAHKNFDVE